MSHFLKKFQIMIFQYFQITRNRNLFIDMYNYNVPALKNRAEKNFYSGKERFLSREEPLRKSGNWEKLVKQNKCAFSETKTLRTTYGDLYFKYM